MHQFSNILLIDTSKPIVWVALISERKIVAEKEWTGDTTLGVKLLAVIQTMTQKARPDRIAVHRGPGQFMAVRTGVVTAQLLAQAWGVEFVSVDGQEREDIILAGGVDTSG